MKVMVIGSGAREHALVWKISQSRLVDELFAVPGNGGTTELALNIPIDPANIRLVVEEAKLRRADLVVVGPEGPLALGLTDELQRAGIMVFGPTKGASRLEWSKVYARELMESKCISCARGKAFSTISKASALFYQEYPLVVKVDGLAAGKGVTIAGTREEARQALCAAMVEKVFGEAGDWVILEQFLRGKEASLLAFTDGETVVPMVSACDYKKVGSGDQGPNTGGMGSYSPSEFLNDGQYLIEGIRRRILIPIVQAMAGEGYPFKGILYAGLMITNDKQNNIKVLEFNVRFGDPEAQVILPRLKTDLVEIMLAVVSGTLDQIEIEWSDEACVGVVLASEGYPGKYRTGLPISGLDTVDQDLLVFHAGTGLKDGQLVTTGGRVLTVVAKGKSMIEAREKVYANVPRISFPGCHYRKDIAERACAKAQQ